MIQIFIFLVALDLITQPPKSFQEDCPEQQGEPRCPCELLTDEGCQPCCNCSSCRWGYWERTKRCKLPCFPSEAEIKLVNGKSVKMSKLQIGDHVPTGKPLIFSDF